MEDQYAKFLIKQGAYWEVYLHQNQHYLGRSYIWAKRPTALDFLEMTAEEQSEFFTIGRELKHVLDSLFKPDLYNYAAFANTSPHLHVHIIPRYKIPREFCSHSFIDQRWGRNYAPYDTPPLSEELILSVAAAVKSKFLEYFKNPQI